MTKNVYRQTDIKQGDKQLSIVEAYFLFVDSFKEKQDIILVIWLQIWF